jgi:hypothetical protein
MDEFSTLFIQYQDYLAPRLDVYEQAIYVFLLRQTHVEGRSEAVIGFKSARRKLGFGIGKANSPPSEGVVYEKLRSLEAKHCIALLASERAGTRIRVYLPSEITGVVPPPAAASSAVDLEQLDFFSVPENRALILARESWHCFYCLARLDENNHVLEHVVSRPEGSNSYRNVVAACRRCNNKKGAKVAEDHVRSLYREGILSGDELAIRVQHLEALRTGLLKPKWPGDDA